MKILCVHNYYQNPGGEDSVFSSEKLLLESCNHNVLQYIEDNKRLNNTGNFKIAYSAIWSAQSKRNLYHLIQKEKPDVAHFHNTFLLISPSAYYACREAGVPVVQTLHNYRLICPSAILFRDNKVCEDCMNKLIPYPGIIHGCWRNSKIQTATVSAMLAFHRLIKTWVRNVDIYIALTDFARKKFIQGGLPAEKIVVKPNFMQSDSAMDTEKDDYVLFVGRLSQEKGVKTLLESWGNLFNIPLKIAGNGPMKDQIFNQNTNIEVLGHKTKDQIIHLMKKARFLVFPSEWYEGFPMTIVESFACSTPVIASRLGGMNEIIDDGRTGLHFNPGDPIDLAEKVKWAWRNPVRIAEMGKEARQEYELKYTAEKNYNMLMEIYQKAIEINNNNVRK